MKEFKIYPNVYGPIQANADRNVWEKYLYGKLVENGFDMETPILTIYNRTNGMLKYIQKTQSEALGYDTSEVVTQSGIVLPKTKLPD